MTLSIITITYNNLEGLKRTAESILSQTYKDFEWLVIDGGSKDGTKEYIESLERQPDYWCSEPDSGVYDAMNKGIAKATGEYLLFMNAGDSFYKETILKDVYKNFPQADIVYGDAMFHYAHRTREMKHPDQLTLDYFCRCSLCHQATFIRASLLQKCGGYSTDYRIVSDWRQWIVWLKDGRSFVHLPLIVCNYMMDGLSSINVRLSVEEREKVFKEILPSWQVGLYIDMCEYGGYYELIHLPRKRKKYLKTIRLLITLASILLLSEIITLLLLILE